MADIKDELTMSPKNKEKVKRMYADEMILEAIGNVFGFTKQYIIAIIKFSGNKQELAALN